MKRLFKYGLLFVLLLSGISNLQAKPRTTITGRVACNNQAIAGVVISDGYKVVTTDSDGNYTLKSALPYGYIFLSMPSGYEVPTTGLLPQFFAYVNDNSKAASVNFELSKVDNSKCRLVIYNDIHLTNDYTTHDLDQCRNGFIPEVMETIAGFGDEKIYGITLGDMTTDSRWYRQNFALPEYLAEVAPLNIPVFHSMGNHDNDMRAGGGDHNSASTYRRVIGPNFYSFNLGAFHIVVLDDIVYDNPLNEKGNVASVTDYHTYIDDDQLVWLERDLATIKHSTPLIVCTHAPFFRIENVLKGEDVLKDGFSKDNPVYVVTDILKDFESVYILSGHTHQNYFVQGLPNILEHNNIAVAASSWKTDPICGINFSRDGTPGGYSVYTIDGNNLLWYYQPVGYVKEECQFRSYDLNMVPMEFGDKSQQNLVWINVFNYDPQWIVEVTENGRQLPVERIWVKDPLYAMAVKGSNLMNSSAFKPIANSHMLRVQTSSPNTTLMIKVTDRFGNCYTETMERPKQFGIKMNLGNK